MTISFYCDSCYQLVETPDATANKKGRCPHCGHVQFIPATSTANPAPTPPPAQASSTVDSLLQDVQELGNRTAAGRRAKPVKAGDWKKSKKEQGWGDDRFASRYAAEMERVDRTSRALAIPSIGLIVSAILLYISSVLVVLYFAFYMLLTATNQQFNPLTGIILLVVVGWNCFIATLGIVGANHMKQVRSYSMSVGGCMLMCLPHSAWPIGFLFGVWGLVLLANGENRDSFRKS